MAHVLENFDKWKEFLGNRVEAAQSAGMNTDKIADVAYQIGGFLSDKVDPKNSQERLLKQMWEVSSPEDRHALARTMVNLVSRDH
ncbi:DUF3243 domain-containing protein [Fodinisporobacter ferrooxydans]|uniref:DUF3243 domain-containing protein n=1 Tax=Fodinisporobacter ferrooxydans TaxID=2901836 RepID=A0ABY4CQV4_9BACL|nr:DUF3243 domain-containing protein [Alicyclobacillaceae bacterium MYW30-H2]